MPPAQIAVDSAMDLLKAPATNYPFSKRELTVEEKELAEDKFFLRVIRALEVARPVAILREELLRKYLHSE